VRVGVSEDVYEYVVAEDARAVKPWVKNGVRSVRTRQRKRCAAAPHGRRGQGASRPARPRRGAPNYTAWRGPVKATGTTWRPARPPRALDA
jgi:hypothetical protein